MRCKPLSLWRDPSGSLRWHWKAVPAPRPLYGLDQIAAKPDAPIVLCEGDVDAAARVFLNAVVTTSPDGAGAASKADWRPLAGRRVMIWPDADEPGAKYALRTVS
jgi:putative DNA primase/helicase